MNNRIHLQQQKYVFELNEHDVLCGRGSGPNDRVGNIEFRNLVLSRKAEYLAAPSRDAKGRIATGIVDTVRSRGGRFLKKLSPAQTKEAGFKRGTTVYEYADEATVLEKAKQTLRQNRAEFVKEHGGVKGVAAVASATGGNVVGGPTPSLTASPGMAPTPTPSNTMGGMSPATTSNNMALYQQQQQLLSNNIQMNGGTSTNNMSIQGSMNPIPLDGSVSLDSMQRPNLSARTTQQLNNALFNTSSNISSLTNPSMTAGAMTNMSTSSGTTDNNMNNTMGANQLLGSNNNTMNMGQNQIQMGSTNSGASNNMSILSMNTADLASAMGGSNVFNSTASNNSNNSNTLSGTSTQAFGNLIKEYSTSEEETKNLMQQFEELKAQQELLLQQQQSLPGNTNFQPGNMQFIPEDQQAVHQQQFQYHQNFQTEPQQQQQAQQQQGGQQQGGQQQAEEKPSDVFASLVRQYAPNNPMFNTTQPQQFYDPASSQNQQPQPQQPTQGSMPSNAASVNQNNTSFSNNTNGDLTGSVVPGLSDQEQQKLFEQFQMLQQRTQQTLAANMNQSSHSQNSQTQYNAEPSYLDNSNSSLNDVGNTSQHSQNSQVSNNNGGGGFVDTTTSLNDSQPLQYNTEAYMDSKTQLNDSQATLPSGSLQYGMEAYMDSTTQLNDSQATLPSGSLQGTAYYNQTTSLNDLQPSKYRPVRKEPLSNSDDSDNQKGSDEPEKSLPKWDPTQRRRSSTCRRRSTLGRDNRTGNSMNSHNQRRGSGHSTSSRRGSGLSTLEPADLSEDSLRLSFLTANQLAKTLDDMSTTSIWMSGTSTMSAMKQSAVGKASFRSNLDASMLSLMSMSLSEIAPELLPQNQKDSTLPNESNTPRGGNQSNGRGANEHGDINEKILSGLEEEADAKPRPSRPLEVTVQKKGSDEHGLTESIMSFGQSLDEGAWHKEEEE